jgi:hypothetical protein
MLAFGKTHASAAITTIAFITQVLKCKNNVIRMPIPLHHEEGEDFTFRTYLALFVSKSQATGIARMPFLTPILRQL